MRLYTYENKNGFYHKTYRYSFIVLILVLTSLLFGALFIKESIKSNKLGRYNDQLTERFVDSTDTCTRLAGELRECSITIDQCRNICESFEATTRRDVKDVREAIELIEELREAIGEMEIALDLWDSDGYYSWLDSYVFDNEVKNGN